MGKAELWAGLVLVERSRIPKYGAMLMEALDFPHRTSICSGGSAVEPGSRRDSNVISIFHHMYPEGQHLEYERILPRDRDGRIVRAGTNLGKPVYGYFPHVGAFTSLI